MFTMYEQLTRRLDAYNISDSIFTRRLWGPINFYLVRNIFAKGHGLVEVDKREDMYIEEEKGKRRQKGGGRCKDIEEGWFPGWRK